MTDCKYTAIEAMQTSLFNCPPNCASGIAKRPGQLPDRDDTMLPLRKLR